MADQTIPRDEFSTAMRGLSSNQGAIRKESTIGLEDFYGNVVTWVVTSFRLEGRSTVLIQKQAAEGGIRLVLPEEVTAAMERHAAGSGTVARRRGAASAAAKRRALGVEPDISRMHTPEARAKAAETRAKRAKRRK